MEKVFYLCDMEKCENCSGITHKQCFHTIEKDHAKYKNDSHLFKRNGDALFEQEIVTDKQGIMVIKTEIFFKEDDLDKLRNEFIAQINSGCILIPSGFTYEYIPIRDKKETEK